MDALYILFFLFIFFAFVTLIGHGIWVVLAWFIRQLSGRSGPPSQSSGTRNLDHCPNCNARMFPQEEGCLTCGWRRASQATMELLKDLAATRRQLERLYRTGAIDETAFQRLMQIVEAERQRITLPQAYREPPRYAEPPPSREPAQQWQPRTPSQPQTGTPPPPPTAPPSREQAPFSSVNIPEQPPPVVEDQASRPGHVEIPTRPPATTGTPVGPPSYLTSEQATPSSTPHQPPPQPSRPPPPPPPAAPRKPFAEVLAAFMEQSNIRWGEIVGGLLIIGCSTALVVSLWNEIARIPVLKFFIFTTVTAALFGVGFYTEHRWKLPTTSRGVLTIATLLVPLNFLAIAAVTGGVIPTGPIIIASELAAPALFLTLVYFAGRIITPDWPQLLVSGVLGSSVGQLLVRHFAGPEISTWLLVALGAFPIAWYAAGAVWMLRKADADTVIDESEANAIFITLGASTFAALLPFGLLLYKTGHAALTLMHLAPLVCLGSLPLLASGLLLWQRLKGTELAAARTAGTSLAILGALLSLAGVIMAWPNPASVLPAALFNFLIFTFIAARFELPSAHLLAAASLALGYLIGFHILVGHVGWQTAPEFSLSTQLISLSTGQALAPLFVLYIIAAEWLAKRGHTTGGNYYLLAASIIGVLSFGLVTIYGSGHMEQARIAAAVYAVQSLGAFWIASRRRLVAVSWIATGLLLLAIMQTLDAWFGVRFVWQASLLLNASVCAVAAIVCRRRGETARRILSAPLNWSALICSFAAVLMLVEARELEPTQMIATRLFWLAGIWLALLWLNRKQLLFTAFQIALTSGVVVTVKLYLQSFDWYAYLPHASLHPWSLQIQGVVLILLSLAWTALRLSMRRGQALDANEAASKDETNERASQPEIETEDWRSVARKFLDSRQPSFDRAVTAFVLCGFVLLAIYGAASGIRQELATKGSQVSSLDIAGFAHSHALEAGSWILLGLLLVAMLAGLWERRRTIYVLGAVLALSTLCPLLAGRFEAQFAVASAWRLLAAGFLFTASLALWLRAPLKSQLKAFGWPVMETDAETLAQRTRALVFLLTLTPLLALTAYPALKIIWYLPVHGPSSGFFYFIGDILSYSIPLALVALVFAGHAVRERAASFAFAAGLVSNITVTMAQLLSVALSGGAMNRVVLAQVVQLNAITSACFALLWLGTRNWWLKQPTNDEAAQSELLLKLQVGIGTGANILLIVPALLGLFARPTWTGIGTFEVGSLRGWFALILTVAAVTWFDKAFRRQFKAGALCATILATGALVAFDAARFDLVAHRWLGYHAFLAASALIAWLMLFAARLSTRFAANEAQEISAPTTESPDSPRRRFVDYLSANWSREARLFAILTGALTVVLALRAASVDPARPWWPALALVAMSALAAGLNWQTLHRAYLYAAGILFNIAVTIWWTTQHWNWRAESGIELFEVNVIALALPGIIWLLMEMRARRIDGSEMKSSGLPPFHQLAALGALAVLIALVSFGMLANIFGQLFADAMLRPDARIGWLAVASAVALMCACLWDRQSKFAVAGLYLLGLVAMGLTLNFYELTLHRLGWLIMLALAAYALLTSALWKSRETLAALAVRLKVPRREVGTEAGLLWLSLFNGALVLVVLGLAYWIILRFAELPLRLSAAAGVMAQALTFGLMAGGAWRARWQRAALGLFSAGAVFFGWALLVPGASGTWLNRAVVLMIVSFTLIVSYGVLSERATAREPEWTSAARRCVAWLAGTGALALVFVLGAEISYQINFGAVRISTLSLVVVAVTLTSAAIACVVFAVSHERDPLKLSESGRMKYVYVAEVLLALLFMHIRLTMPWLFTGFFTRYWPLVVVGIAYLGVATSEGLRRQGLMVLAHPVERTGAFLPLLPVLGFWAIDSRVDYSTVLLMIGMLYGGLSILRRSFLFGVLAALAGNGSLWYMLHRTESFGLIQHPQLWLIPIALSVLIAAYLNAESFSEDQMTTIRYIALMVIYVSSTSDIFINGVAESPWLPLVLAALSLAGVLCGITLRVRAFLFLGATFLLIAVITMIWYASVNLGWTWLWYVAGIATGALIIFTFAMFEKKRSEMLRVVEGLREWER